MSQLETALAPRPTTEVVPAAGPGIPAELRRRGLAGVLTGRIDVKIIGPYVIVMLLLLGLASFVTLRLLTDQLTQRFQNQLLDAGKAANDSVIKVEQEQLELLRLMSATIGVDQAIVADNPVALQRLLVPLETNSQYKVIEVLNRQGHEVLALRPTSGPLAGALDPSIASWSLTKQVVSGVADAYGNKYSNLVQTSFGKVFYTGGPVTTSSGQVVGGILVGLPFNDFLLRLGKDVGTSVTVYGPNGQPLGTTLPQGTSLAISPALFQQAVDPKGKHIVLRPLTLHGEAYRELLGQLFVGHNIIAGALGVEVPTPAIAQASAQTQRQMTILFGVVFIAVLFIGRWVTRSITRPVLVLVKACQLVASGDLEQRVHIKGRDETGVLGTNFNTMVSGLKERDFIKDTFGKYMNEAVSNAILSGDVKLGGERKSVTVMITHIRWSGARPFASLYEKIEAEELVTFLNNYFHSMVDCIIRYEGIVDKFVADEILAVFGAPIPHEDDARRAVLAALEMRRRLVPFNEQLQAMGQDPIRIGMGLYSGPVVSGNIGSEVRMEYTVIGDTVNCTARTEELTKEFQTDLLIGDTTYELVQEFFDVADPHYITLRGRTQESAVYPVIGLKEDFEELLSDQGPILSTDELFDQERIDAQLAAASQ